MPQTLKGMISADHKQIPAEVICMILNLFSQRVKQSILDSPLSNTSFYPQIDFDSLLVLLKCSLVSRRFSNFAKQALGKVVAVRAPHMIPSYVASLGCGYHTQVLVVNCEELKLEEFKELVSDNCQMLLLTWAPSEDLHGWIKSLPATGVALCRILRGLRSDQFNYQVYGLCKFTSMRHQGHLFNLKSWAVCLCTVGK